MILYYTPGMRALTTLLLFSLLLSACGSLKQSAAPVQSGGRSATVRGSALQPPSRTPLIFREANRLAGEVEQGHLTRLEAADELNTFRVRVAGSNRIDDSTFATYRYLAAQRDSGRMTAEESHSRMEMKLRDWQRLWPGMRNRPVDPAFTNFLMQLFNLPLLDASRP